MFSSQGEAISNRLMNSLITLYSLADFQAAGGVGNLAYESGGFKELREKKPIAGLGGFGYAMWTGARSRDFLNYATRHALDWESYKANEGFLIYELDTDYKWTISALLKTETLEQAVISWEHTYEGAGIIRMEDRINWAELVLKSWRENNA